MFAPLLLAKMFNKEDILLVFVLTTAVTRVTEECTVKNITCEDIKNRDGYTFPLDSENQSTVLDMEITQNGTPIVIVKDGKPECSAEVVKCDLKSITTRECRMVEITIYNETGGRISETCLTFNITDTPKDSLTASRPTAGIVVAVLGAMGILAWFLWRKRQKKKRYPAAVLPRCLGEGNPATHGDKSDEENNLNQRKEDQQLLKEKSGNKDSTDVSIDMKDMTSTNEDDKVVPRVSEVLPQKGLNGNMGHDPGGGKADTELHWNGTCEQKTLGGQSDRDNGCLPFRNNGSAREEASDETAGDEGQVLVDSPALGSERTAPPRNVEKDYKNNII